MRATIHRHIGVRAEGMILAAGIWLLLGAGVLAGQAPDYSGAWHALLPPAARFGLWALPAVLALATCVSERWSPVGLASLTVPPVVTMCSYLTAWGIELVPGPPPGDPGGWYRAAIYAALIALVVLLSHIPATVRAPLTGRRR